MHLLLEKPTPEMQREFRPVEIRRLKAGGPSGQRAAGTVRPSRPHLDSGHRQLLISTARLLPANFPRASLANLASITDECENAPSRKSFQQAARRGFVGARLFLLDYQPTRSCEEMTE
jgi:hypothetical protein